MHLFDNKVQEKNLILRKSYDARIPEVLVGDPMRLNQVILNLLSNAVKFTTMGEIELAIKLLHEDSKQVSLEFLVKDTGIGIKEESISSIFENFQQASSGTFVFMEELDWAWRLSRKSSKHKEVESMSIVNLALAQPLLLF